MDFSEFLQELAKYKGDFCIKKNFDSIRCLKNGLWCPITYIYFKKTGETYLTPAYPFAAMNMGMSLNLAHQIARAADSSIDSYTDKEGEYREQMLEVLGLKSDSNNEK